MNWLRKALREEMKENYKGTKWEEKIKVPKKFKNKGTTWFIKKAREGEKK